MAEQQDPSTNHYDLLGIQPTASPQQIRRAYRDLSKLYHPDTTDLPDAVATERFQARTIWNHTPSAPDKRLAYDYSIGYSRVAVMQAPAYLNRPAAERSRYESSSAYLDPTDRPLSAGELFALFILGITFVCCLMLVLTISFTHNEPVQAAPPAAAFEDSAISPAPPPAIEFQGMTTTDTPAPTVVPAVKPWFPPQAEPLQAPQIPTPILSPP
ncbi:MAG: J domain-containing protein [Cyanobacteria bacterium]|nr:J domain-containing protein [Cyanobacteriota bacterium]